MKRGSRRFVILLLCLAALIVLPYVFLKLTGGIEDHSQRKEVFRYVLEHKDEISIEPQSQITSFVYARRGMPSASVEYGYYYSPDDAFIIDGQIYRKGYRQNGYGGDSTDWLYTERICENWFYYEFHDG